MKALSLLEMCKNIKDVNQLQNIMAFYCKKFEPELILVYFKNWTIKKTDEYKNGLILTNTHSTENWNTTMTFNDNSAYMFADNKKCWEYIPKTFSDFITDIQRYSDFDLIFSEKSISELDLNANIVTEKKTMPENSIKTTLVSELYEFSKENCTIYLQKEKGNIRILNEKKKEEFIFRNYKASRTVSELINYALKSIE